MSQLEHISQIADRTFKPKFKKGDWVRVLPGSCWGGSKLIGAIGQVINDGKLYPEVQFPKKYNIAPLYFANHELMFLHEGTVEVLSGGRRIPRGLK